MKTETFAALQAGLPRRIVEGKASRACLPHTPGHAVVRANSRSYKGTDHSPHGQQPQIMTSIPSASAPIEHPFNASLSLGAPGRRKNCRGNGWRVVPAHRSDHINGPATGQLPQLQPQSYLAAVRPPRHPRLASAIYEPCCVETSRAAATPAKADAIKQGAARALCDLSS